MGWRELRVALMKRYATAWLELDNEKQRNKLKLRFYGDTPNGLLNVWSMDLQA